MSQAEDWVLLAYRLPRVPSTPRSAVWRKLKRLGVAWLGDGLVALPADARTREQLEWIAEEVTDHGGEATLWLGRPLDAAAARAVAGRMTAAVAAEYDAVAAEAAAARHGRPGGPAAGRRAAAPGTAPHPGTRLLRLPAAQRSARRAVEQPGRGSTRRARA